MGKYNAQANRDQFNDAISTLADVEWNLLGLANVLEQAGNSKVGTDLRYEAGKVGEAIRMIQRADLERLDEQIRRADENSVTILKAALAGGEVERAKK